MSIADKKVFRREIEQSVGQLLTVVQTSEVMKMLAEHLDSYDMKALDIGGNESDLDLLQVYLDAKSIAGLSQKSLAHYKLTINLALKDIGVPIRKLTIYHIRPYFKQLKDSGLKESTINNKRDILCAFFGWLYREKLIESDPTANLAPTKRPKVIRKPYSTVEMERLKEACDNDRDRAIVFFLRSTGCRINEVCALNRDDINFTSMSLVVYGKGAKERTVFIDEVTSMVLKRYLDSRTDSSEALFVGKGTDRLTDDGFRYILRRLSKKSGVENVHPHRFRRTLATSLIDHGMPIQEVAVILGHDKIDTTLKYVYICNDNVKNAYRKYA